MPGYAVLAFAGTFVLGRMGDPAAPGVDLRHPRSAPSVSADYSGAGSPIARASSPPSRTWRCRSGLDMVSQGRIDVLARGGRAAVHRSPAVRVDGRARIPNPALQRSGGVRSSRLANDVIRPANDCGDAYRDSHRDGPGDADRVTLIILGVFLARLFETDEGVEHFWTRGGSSAHLAQRGDTSAAAHDRRGVGRRSRPRRLRSGPRAVDGSVLRQSGACGRRRIRPVVGRLVVAGSGVRRTAALSRRTPTHRHEGGVDCDVDVDRFGPRRSPLDGFVRARPRRPLGALRGDARVADRPRRQCARERSAPGRIRMATGRGGLTVTALVVAIVPFAAIFAGGRFDLPTTSVAESLSTLAPSSSGGYRVLWLGGPSVLPLAGWSVAPGLAAPTSMDGLPTGTSLFTTPDSGTSNVIVDAVESALKGETVRLGQLLAPAGISTIVVMNSSGAGITRRPDRSAASGAERAVDRPRSPERPVAGVADQIGRGLLELALPRHRLGECRRRPAHRFRSFPVRPTSGPVVAGLHGAGRLGAGQRLRSRRQWPAGPALDRRSFGRRSFTSAPRRPAPVASASDQRANSSFARFPSTPCSRRSPFDMATGVAGLRLGPSPRVALHRTTTPAHPRHAKDRR